MLLVTNVLQIVTDGSSTTVIADEPTATPAETTSIAVDATTTMAQKTTTPAETAPIQMTTTQGIIQEFSGVGNL